MLKLLSRIGTSLTLETCTPILSSSLMRLLLSNKTTKLLPPLIMRKTSNSSWIRGSKDLKLFGNRNLETNGSLMEMPILNSSKSLLSSIVELIELSLLKILLMILFFTGRTLLLVFSISMKISSKLTITTRIALTLVVQHFFKKGFLLKSLNRAFIALIPKTKTASQVDHYRPISLCNVTYKIISKILANRLKPFIPRFISPFQNGFCSW